MTGVVSRKKEPCEDYPLTDIMQVVMRVGILMLRSGTISFRVEQAMNRVALALGVDRLDAYVTLTGITASAHRGAEHYTQVARIQSIGVNMTCLSAVEYLSQHLPTCTPESLSVMLDKIEHTPPQYPLRLLIPMIAIACGAFAVLSGGDGIDFGAASAGAGMGQLLRHALGRIRLNAIAATVSSAAIATLSTHYTLQVLRLAGLDSPTAETGYLASVLFLVPGMPLVTATLDFFRFDIVSGLTRATYALIVMIAVALGVLLAIALTGASIL